MGFFNKLINMGIRANKQRIKQEQAAQRQTIKYNKASEMQAKSVANEIRIIKESHKIVNETKTISTKTSRLKVLNDVINRLAKYNGTTHFRFNDSIYTVKAQFESYGARWNVLANDLSSAQSQFEATRKEFICPYCNAALEKGLKCKACGKACAKYKDSDKGVHYLAVEEDAALKFIEQEMLNLKLVWDFNTCYSLSSQAQYELDHIYDKLKA